MKRIIVENFGTEVQGVRLFGNPVTRPEPESFRVTFPGGEVDVTRATDDPNCDYWVHVHVFRDDDVVGERAERIGHLVDARLDIDNMSTTDVNVGDFVNPNLYHLAVRVSRQQESTKEQPSLL